MELCDEETDAIYGDGIDSGVSAAVGVFCAIYPCSGIGPDGCLATGAVFWMCGIVCDSDCGHNIGVDHIFYGKGSV